MEDGSKPATLLQLMRTDFEKLIEEYAGLKKRFAFIGQMRVRNQAKKVFYISVRVRLGGVCGSAYKGGPWSEELPFGLTLRSPPMPDKYNRMSHAARARYRQNAKSRICKLRFISGVSGKCPVCTSAVVAVI